MDSRMDSITALIREMLQTAHEQGRDIGRVEGRINGRADEPAESERLREALRPFVRHYEPWMDEGADDVRMSTFSAVTYGELRRALALLAPPTSQEPHVPGASDHIMSRDLSGNPEDGKP